ncbi:MAG TPA: hypothetical protein VMN57_02400 [Anaerolineales bacterium]|nr:hypothetical protein [Anaerolineales bacterium]
MKDQMPDETEKEENDESSDQTMETGSAWPSSDPKPPGRVNLYARKLARSLVIASILFLGGMAIAYFAFQRPLTSGLNDRIEQLTSEKGDLEAQVTALVEQVETLEPFEAENQALQSSLAQEELHVRLLSALKDVQSAQLSLALGEVDAARLSLSRTEDRLEELGELLPADQQGVVDGMVQRLGLVIDGMESDAFAAASDLEVLANSLLQLENTLFTSP